MPLGGVQRERDFPRAMSDVNGQMGPSPYVGHLHHNIKLPNENLLHSHMGSPDGRSARFCSVLIGYLASKIKDGGTQPPRQPSSICGRTSSHVGGTFMGYIGLLINVCSW